MSTQTGKCSIDAIEGPIVRGTFESVYENNVYTPTHELGAMLLYDAFSSLAGKHVVEKELTPFIISVEFDKPNSPKTNFVIKVRNASILEGLETGCWDSYYVG
jgi:hypothetical protein